MVAREVPADDRRSQWVVAFSIHRRMNINIDATRRLDAKGAVDA
jgi:hypothetical protein